ncbi:phosphotransferase [Tabrizicola sp.]|uniref:phosphotransferase enzyme family protein n=1 Tax=Tabrizicola sp. TaxID=2005166 RepID=UPI001A4175EE|nr:phosphotransferase [Tabrizicola sp.]MBL9073752.1 phosphotransferase [Tabrizicola sp.]
MNQVIETALALWGKAGASVELVATRENHVYRLDHEGAAFALRLHRSGYRSDGELQSELAWMAAVARGGLRVPAPVPALSGDLLLVIGGAQVDLLTWLDGSPVGKTGEPLQATDRSGLFRAIGREMARLHLVSDGWNPAAGFARTAWDRPGLLGEAPVWGRFWENPSLSAPDRQLFVAFRDLANARLRQLEGQLDYGLIHADLVRENIILDDKGPQFIDFDDGGFGFRLFDLATALIKNLSEPDFPMLRQALLEGYLALRPIDLDHLDLFLTLRAATYLGWIIPRMDEPGAVERNRRLISVARHLAEACLGKPETGDGLRPFGGHKEKSR